VPYDPDAVKAGETVRGKVQKIERFGVFVWLGPGRIGLMPAVWSGVPQGRRLDASYRPGQDVEVQVVEITEGGRRIRLAAPGVEADPSQDRGGRGVDREAAQRLAEASDDGQFGTSLGDVLRAALDRSKDE
jgi:ribosomal protein S1